MIKYAKIWFVKATLLLLSGIILLTFSMLDAKAEQASVLNQLELRQEVKVTGSKVTLGDIFTNVGDAGDVYVANAPQLGQANTIPVSDILSLIQRYELNWERPGGVTRVRVERRSQTINSEDLKLIVSDAVSRDGGPDKFMLTLYGNFQNIQMPIDANLSQVSVNMVNIDARTGRFTTSLNIPKDDYDFSSYRLTGRIEELVSVPVLSSGMSKDDIIYQSHITWIDLPKQRLSQNILRSTEGLIGKAARRSLRADTPLRLTDVQEPVLIRKGTLVSMQIQSGPMRLTTIGRALEDGGKGDMIKIVNVDSHKTIEGRVVGADSVEILYFGNLTGAGQ